MTIMSRFGTLLLTTLVLGMTGASPAGAQASQGAAPATQAENEAGIRRTMAAYNAALNGGKTDAVLPLYTPDGIFMAPFSQSNIGIDAVKTAYDQVFQELAFNVKFDIRELVVLSPVYAYVRTNSAGTTRHASTGKTTSEANQDLFILRKGEDGMWRIARYSFSPTNAPANG